MFALDLFNNDHERHLAEGAVDQLEQRRIDDLAMKMDDLVARAKKATTPEVKAALVKEFQKCKAERDGYFKIKEAGIPGSVPADKIPGKEDLLKGRGRSYYEDQKKNAEVTDPAQDRLLTRAHREYPKARTDAEALAMKILGKEQDDVDRLDRVNDREDRMIAKLDRLEQDLQSQINQLKGTQDLDEGRMGEIDAMRQDLERMNERQFYTAYGISKAAFQQKYRTLLKPALDESQQLHQGDPIVVTAPNEFEGATGEIYDFSPSGTFVIVDLYNHGKHSMHLSDITYNEYADQEQDEEDDWYDDGAEDTLETKLDELSPQTLRSYIKKSKGHSQKYDQKGNKADEKGDEELANKMWNKGDNRYAGEVQARAKLAGVDEGFQDFNKVEPYAVCLAGKPVKKFDYYEQARKFHDNWKQKLYREGNKEKADKITLMPLNLDEGARGDAIKQGYQAAVKGLTKQQNPYYKSVNGQTPPEAYDWEAGWEDARDSGKIPQGVAEGGYDDPKIQFLQPTIQFAEKMGYRATLNPQGRVVAKLVNKQLGHIVHIGLMQPSGKGFEVSMADNLGKQTNAWSAKELAQDFKGWYAQAVKDQDFNNGYNEKPQLEQQGVAEDTDSWFRVTVKTPNGKNHNIQVPANSHGTAKRKALAYCAKNSIAGAEFVSAMRMPTLDEQGVAEGDDLTHAGQDVMVWTGPPTNNPPRDDKKYWVRGQLDSTEMHGGSMRANVMTTKGMYNPELSRVFKAEQGVAEGIMDELTPYELGEAEGLSGEYYENPYPEGSKSYAEYRQGWRDGTKQAEANRDVDETYTPIPAKPFRNPPGFNKQGTGVGNKLAQLTRAELANIKPSTGTPVPGKEFAQGVLKDLKKVNVKEIKADPAGSWIVYGGSKVMKFKTHGGAKAYAEKNGGKVASSEFYADKIQKQGVSEGSMSNLHADLADVYNRLAPGIERYRDSFKAGELYDALEAVAEQNGAETEFKRMMAGARNRAHMDYDTNPGGFQNWFWYLPFAEEELSENQDTSGVERAILNRIMVAHTDLLKQFGPQKVMQAAEEVAYNVGDVDEIGTSDVSAYVDQVRQILGA